MTSTDANGTESAKQPELILHQIPRGYFTPSISPFPLKLETYLRINKVPYKNDFTKPMGSNGKTPWVMYDGKAIADSQVIMEYLNEKLNIDMNSHLTDEQRTIVKAFKHLIEDHMYWLLLHGRWVQNNGEQLNKIADMFTGLKGKILLPIVRKKLKDQCYAQGTGRHTNEEIMKMLSSDVKAIVTFLGSKPYLMGDTICEEDCTLFGFLAQIVYNMPGDDSRKTVLEEELPKIKEYVERIKKEYWPDWDECLIQPKGEKKHQDADKKIEEKKHEKKVEEKKDKKKLEENETEVKAEVAQ